MIVDLAQKNNNLKEKFSHKAFEISLLFKGIDGILEIIGGVALFFIKPALLNSILLWVFQKELSEDPNDFIVNFLIKISKHYSVNDQVFSALYLLSHGVIKVYLIIALFKRKLWAYPSAISFFALFIAYQMYRYSLGRSQLMLLLSIIDVIVIALTWLEYKRLKLLVKKV